MKEHVLHPSTQQELQAIKQSPPHGLLIIGPSGIGKYTLSIHLLEDLLETNGTSYEEYPYSLVVQPPKDKKSIGIDAIRELEKFLTLKVPRQKPLNRGIIIENADLMTVEAQNALLKTLEEPPKDTIIVLTASHKRALLPTIISRLQTLTVHKPEKSAVMQIFTSTVEKNEPELDKIYAMSSGLPGLMTEVESNPEHPLKIATTTAKELLASTCYHRLLKVDELAKDKQLTKNTIYMLQQMAHSGLKSNSSKNQKKWQLILESSYDAIQALELNGQAKLTLANLMLHL